MFTLLQPAGGKTVAIPFLTHFADLSSWEYAQKLSQRILPQLRDQGVQVSFTGLAYTADQQTAAEPCSAYL